MNKKELSSNEIEKVTGGTGGEQKEPLPIKKDDSRPWHFRPPMRYGGPCHFEKILRNKEKIENPEDKN